jgi:multiple sugar transport system ATP-binding protein
MASVEIRHVSKAFGEYRAVNDVEIAAEDGKFLVLLGPSGCGKTTLLRMIAGLDRPTSGDIVIGDRIATTLHPKDRNIAMVFQNYALYPHLTIFENIAFPLRVRHEPDINARVHKAAQLVGIDHLLQRKPRQMSGGERQRTALARSLVRNPDVFLLDEPLSNLDAKLRNSAREELRQFQDRVGGTSIYVTHDQTEAMGLGDRIVVMEKGNVRQIGTPEDIYLRPADTFVASFIGSPPMNLVETDKGILGFRPEIFLPETELAGPLLRLRWTITRMEYLGGERLVYGMLGAPYPETKIVARLGPTVEFAAAPGATLTFAVREADLRWFDRASGRAIAAQPVAPRQVAHV